MGTRRSPGRWPDFVIAGAPRCGTTYLWSVLRQQRGVFMPNLKEPNFFAPDERMGTPGQSAFGVFDERSYLALFSPAGRDDLVGEASTSYLKSRVALPRLMERSPDAKVIVTLRDPVEQISSMHGRFVASGFEDRDLGTALVPELDPDDPRPSRLTVPHTGFVGYLDAARFLQQLERLFSNARREQVLVLLLDEIAADPRTAVERVAAFLCIPDPVLPRAARRNAHCVARSRALLEKGWSPSTIAHAKRIVPTRLHPLASALATRVHRLNRREAVREPMPRELRDRVRDRLLPDLSLAGTLLGVDLVGRWWSD